MLLQAVLHLPTAQLDFPTLAIELDNVGARETHRVDHRGQHLPLLAIDVAGQQARCHHASQLRALPPRLWTGFEMHQSILTSCLRTTAYWEPFLSGSNQVLFAAGCLPCVEQSRAQNPLSNRVSEWSGVRDELLGQYYLVDAAALYDRLYKQVAGEPHLAEHAYLRIGSLAMPRARFGKDSGIVRGSTTPSTASGPSGGSAGASAMRFRETAVR